MHRRRLRRDEQRRRRSGRWSDPRRPERAPHARGRSARQDHPQRARDGPVGPSPSRARRESASTSCSSGRAPSSAAMRRRRLGLRSTASGRLPSATSRSAARSRAHPSSWGEPGDRPGCRPRAASLRRMARLANGRPLPRTAGGRPARRLPREAITAAADCQLDEDLSWHRHPSPRFRAASGMWQPSGRPPRPSRPRERPASRMTGRLIRSGPTRGGAATSDGSARRRRCRPPTSPKPAGRLPGDEQLGGPASRDRRRSGSRRNGRRWRPPRSHRDTSRGGQRPDRGRPNASPTE